MSPWDVLRIARLLSQPEKQQLVELLEQDIARHNGEIISSGRLQVSPSAGSEFRAAAVMLKSLEGEKAESWRSEKGPGFLEESSAYESILDRGAIRGSHRFTLCQGEKLYGPPNRRDQV